MASTLRTSLRIGVFFAALLIFAVGARGAYLTNIPQELRQPNGDILKCFASGDEYYNWLHDANGYTIVQNRAGWYVFAEPDPVNDIRPSALVAGRSDPRKAGLARGLRLAGPKILARRRNILQAQGQEAPAPAPRAGTINNLAVFIRFSGESEFTNPPANFTDKLNLSGATDKSLYTYFKEVSYNALSITTTLYPTPSTTVLSYQDSHARGYFQPYNETTNAIGYTGGNDGTARRDREHTLLAAAINAIASQVPSGLAIDGDSDGKVDNVTFIVSGSAGGWNDILWPHQWSLYSQTVNLNGKRVYTYNLHLGTSFSVGTLCHEMFHSLGSPDLYHYNNNGIYPLGYWDIMQSAAPGGPQHMSAYMKWKYGTWISSIPSISSSGTYTLNPLTSATNNCYKIASPNSATEYFVVEYRKNVGIFDSALFNYCGYSEGLVVYRINSTLTGNSTGPPDEVYVYRPNGTLSVDGSKETAAFSSGSGRTAINDSTNPSSFLTSGGAGGLNISNVGAVGATISFYVTLPSDSPTISLSDTTFDFGAVQNGIATPAGTTTVKNIGAGTFSWTATRSADWILVSPTSRSGNAVISIGIARTDLSPGTYTGTVSIAAPGATNTPQTINITYNVYGSGGDAAPFGQFDTPGDGVTVRSSIPVTGWALDDIGMQSVKIYRGSGYADRVYIGDAVFVQGARNDVEAAYPTYPQSNKAGWGYMLLTNFLPNSGNGTFTLRAYATDLTGHEVLLGTKTITCDNLHATLPFGAIDTPTQGGTASGSAFNNFGWALTPQPNSIPTNGSTIWVWLNGAALGHPNYGYARGDIQSLFPGYANTNTAVGVYALNTMGYADGVHNIAWSVQDSAGGVDGIGSRFFVISNPVGSPGALEARDTYPAEKVSGMQEDFRTPVYVRRGMALNAPVGTLLPEPDGSVRIIIPEVTRVAVYLSEDQAVEDEAVMLERGTRILRKGIQPDARYEAYELALGRLRPLPIGASFDKRDGVLYWHPGPGFRGEYGFILADTLTKTKKTVRVIVK